MENSKILTIFMEGLLSLIQIFFNGVNKICTSGAQFISNYTDILSVSQLQKLIFITIFVLIIKAFMEGLSDFPRVCNRIIRSLSARTKSNKTHSIQGIHGKPHILNLKNLLPKGSIIKSVNKGIASKSMTSSSLKK